MESAREIWKNIKDGDYYNYMDNHYKEIKSEAQLHA